MQTKYTIVARGDQFGVDLDGKVSGEYLTREAAFEAAAAAASNAIKEGLAVTIAVPGGPLHKRTDLA